MTFNPNNWAVISESGVIPSQTLQSGSVTGAPGLYTYQSATETLATISAANYFSPIGNILQVNDLIYVTGSNGQSWYIVSSASGDPLAVSVTAFSSYTDFIIRNGNKLFFYNPANTHYSSFAEGVSSTDKNYTWPLAAPAVNGYVLSCTTAGVMFWAATGGSGITWTDQTTTPVTIATSNGYITDNAGLVTLNMPANAAVGDTFLIVGKGAGGWLLQMNTGQIANMGSSPTSSAGSLASTNRYDCAELVCVTANTTFVVRSSIGNITVA